MEFIHMPMKMEPIVSSETSAIRTQTPGKYPKRNKLHLEHGESLKTKKLRVFENMVLRRISGARSEELTGEWRRLYNEDLNDLYSSPNIVRGIKSRRMRWAGHVARMGVEKGCIGSWWGNRREGTTGET